MFLGANNVMFTGNLRGGRKDSHRQSICGGTEQQYNEDTDYDGDEPEKVVQ